MKCVRCLGDVRNSKEFFGAYIEVCNPCWFGFADQYGAETLYLRMTWSYVNAAVQAGRFDLIEDYERQYQKARNKMLLAVKEFFGSDEFTAKPKSSNV